VKVLHVILKVQPTNGQYNEHCLPLATKREITVCSFLPATLAAPDSIALFQGDGSLRGGWRALRSARAHGPHDVVHVHAPQTGLILLLAGLLHRRHGGVGDPRRPAPPLRNAIYTVQNSYQNYRLRNRLLMIPILLCYPRVVFCSESARRSLPLLLRWSTRRKGRVVPNCVDVALIDGAVDQRARLKEMTTPFTVISAGRLVPIKDPFLVLEAFADAVPEGRLVYVGDGELHAALAAEVQRRGLSDRVTFTGMVTRDTVYARLAEADLFVSASRGEGLPVAVLEAMACRCPVVLSDIAPHRELADGEGAVALVPVGDVAGFTEAIRRMASLGAHGRSALGERSRRRIEQRYSLAVMHEAYRPIYREAAAAGPS
jgi:glycosyltransferase involved in cell wall biosynthesis